MSPRTGWSVVAALLTASVLTGCNPAQPLIGKWQMDTQKVISQATPNVPGLDAAIAAKMVKLPENMPKVEIELKSNGKAVFTASSGGKNKTESGRWKYKKKEGDTYVLTMTMEGKKEGGEMRVRMVDRDNIEMMPPENIPLTGPFKSLPFTRVKKT
jgi:hypothetical protein